MIDRRTFTRCAAASACLGNWLTTRWAACADDLPGDLRITRIVAVDLKA